VGWSFFIAKKLITKEGKSASRRIFYLAILSVSLSVLIMLLSIATLKGFKYEIEKKISAVQGDFIIDSGRNIEAGEPFPIHDSDIFLLLKYRKSPSLSRVIPSATKACVLKSENEIEGLMAKGIDSLDKTYFQKAYPLKRSISGEFLNGCWISQTTANRLNADTGDRITVVFFVNEDSGLNKPRARKLKILGIYETGVDKIDGQMLVLDKRTLEPFLPINHSYTQIEIWAADKADLTSVRKELLLGLPSGFLRLNTLQEYNRMIFDWLAILNTNVLIILILMILVAITTMGTTLLILIIERTSSIGLLLALGAKSRDISKVFVYKAVWISLIGVLLGNLFAILTLWSQNTFHWIQLNQEIYFIPYVVLKLTVWDWLWVDMGALIIIAMSMLLPARFVRKIDIIKAIRFK
jgi:lipoprotein-releasing system permease protein